MDFAVNARPVSPILTLGEVANYLRVHRSTIYKMLRKRELPAFRVGSEWRFKLDDIDRWQASRVVQPGNDAEVRE